MLNCILLYFIFIDIPQVHCINKSLSLSYLKTFQEICCSSHKLINSLRHSPNRIMPTRLNVKHRFLANCTTLKIMHKNKVLNKLLTLKNSDFLMHYCCTDGFEVQNVCLRGGGGGGGT